MRRTRQVQANPLAAHQASRHTALLSRRASPSRWPSEFTWVVFLLSAIKPMHAGNDYRPRSRPLSGHREGTRVRLLSWRTLAPCRNVSAAPGHRWTAAR
jgi:hypothetical protein